MKFDIPRRSCAFRRARLSGRWMGLITGFTWVRDGSRDMAWLSSCKQVRQLDRDVDVFWWRWGKNKRGDVVVK